MKENTLNGKVIRNRSDYFEKQRSKILRKKRYTNLHMKYN